jgi:hypothetical protein
MFLQIFFIITLLSIIFSLELFSSQVRNYPEDRIFFKQSVIKIFYLLFKKLRNLEKFEKLNRFRKKHNQIRHKINHAVHETFKNISSEDSSRLLRSDKVVISILVAIFFTLTSFLIVLFNPRVIFQGNALSPFNFKISKTYAAVDFPSRISDVVYKTSFEAESYHFHSPDNIGVVVKDGYASAGGSLYVNPEVDAKGYFAESTENNIQPKGEYTVYFNLKIAADAKGDAPVALLEVFDSQLDQFIAQKEIHIDDFEKPGKYQEFAIDFEKMQTGNTQYRVLFTGITELWFDKIRIQPKFENWMIYNSNIYFDDVVDEESKNGIVREAIASRDLRGYVVYRIKDENLPNGRYKAIFRLKTTNNKINKTIAKIIAQDTGPRGKYMSKSIKGTDFKENNKYQTFELEFVATKETQMDYRVFFFDIPKSDIYIDTIKIKSI